MNTQSGRGIEPKAPATFADSEGTIRTGLERNADAANYVGWLAELCGPYVGSTCLEIGAGHGDLAALLSEGRHYEASDLSDECLARLEARFAATPNVTVRAVDVAKFSDEEAFDSILLVNVLEHIADDRGAVARLRSGLKPGGRLIVYVPAFELLYSRFDRDLGHHRRYRKRPLRTLLEGEGFKVLDARYVNMLGAFGWFLYCRVLGRDASDQITVNACDRFVVPVLRRVERWVPPPFGLSVLCVGEKL